MKLRGGDWSLFGRRLRRTRRNHAARVSLLLGLLPPDVLRIDQRDSSVPYMGKFRIGEIGEKCVDEQQVNEVHRIGYSLGVGKTQRFQKEAGKCSYVKHSNKEPVKVSGGASSFLIGDSVVDCPSGSNQEENTTRVAEDLYRIPEREGKAIILPRDANPVPRTTV